MNTLYIITVDYSLEYFTNLLVFFTSLSIISAIYVIINKNPILSILFLIGLFILIALYLIATGMKFIGLSYLLVYVGAVSILFLFILMLFNIRVSEIQSETSTALPLGIILCISIYIPLFRTIYLNTTEKISPETSLYEVLKIFLSHLYSEENNFIFYPQWDSTITEYLHITSIGNILYTNYFLLIIITSFILLLSMIGSIIITINNGKY